MKTLILNGADAGDQVAAEWSQVMSSELRAKNHDVTVMNLSEMKIASCLGCFGCWTKTPGECVIDDAGRDVAKTLIQSDLVVTITPVIFGGYSYELKKAMDRIICLLSPFFTRAHGETHHKARYQRYPRWMTIGLMAESDEAMEASFRNLEERKALHFFCPDHAYRVLLNNVTSEEMFEHITQLLLEVGVSA